MQYQLRVFKITPGAMNQFVAAWLAGVYPLRLRFGFSIPGAWVVEGSDTFIWLLAYEGANGFEAADARYYASAERGAIAPDPAQYVVDTQHYPMRSILPLDKSAGA